MIIYKNYKNYQYNANAKLKWIYKIITKLKENVHYSGLSMQKVQLQKI